MMYRTLRPRNPPHQALVKSWRLPSSSTTEPWASISQDYWGDIKEVPQNLKRFFVKLHIIFALKYNKQQLLLLSTFLGYLDIVSCAHLSRHPKRHHF